MPFHNKQLIYMATVTKIRVLLLKLLMTVT